MTDSNNLSDEEKRLRVIIANLRGRIVSLCNCIMYPDRELPDVEGGAEGLAEHTINEDLTSPEYGSHLEWDPKWKEVEHLLDE